MCVCVCVCVWGDMFDDNFVYVNVVCFDVGCFSLILICTAHWRKSTLRPRCYSSFFFLLWTNRGQAGNPVTSLFLCSTQLPLAVTPSLILLATAATSITVVAAILFCGCKVHSCNRKTCSMIGSHECDLWFNSDPHNRSFSAATAYLTLKKIGRNFISCFEVNMLLQKCSH